MILRFQLSGSIVFEGESDCVPPIGSEVIFRMQAYKKGMDVGELVSATVTDDITPSYDFTGDQVVVLLDVDGFRTIGDDG